MKRKTVPVKSKPRFKIGLVGLMVLLLLAILLFSIYSLGKDSVFWQSQGRTNLVFYTHPFVVVSFPKQASDNTLVVTLPENVSTLVPFGYGLYRLDAVWKLGELEGNRQLFSETVADMLAVPIADWIAKDEAVSINDQVEIISQLKNSFVPEMFLADRSGGKLNLLDKLILWLKLFQNRPQNTFSFAIHTNERLFYTTYLADGSAVKAINEAALDDFLANKFADNLVRSEDLSVKIFNTTQTSQLSKKFARYVNQFGGKVIALDNRQESVDNCRVDTSSKNQKKMLVTWLEDTFACQINLVSETSDADVLIFLGKELAVRWP